MLVVSDTFQHIRYLWRTHVTARLPAACGGVLFTLLCAVMLLACGGYVTRQYLMSRDCEHVVYMKTYCVHQGAMLVQNADLVTGTDHVKANKALSDRVYKIVVAGLPRSGSTWQYNAVRFVLSLGLGIPYRDIPATFGQVPYKRSLPRMYKCLAHHKVCVVKLHMFDQQIVDMTSHVITSYRDPRDIYTSVRSIFPKQKPIEYLREYFGHYAEFLPYVCLDQKYEVMVANELIAIEEIKTFLDLPHVNSTRVVELLAQALHHSKQKKGWDALTGFSDSHVRYKKPGAFKLVDATVAATKPRAAPADSEDSESSGGEKSDSGSGSDESDESEESGGSSRRRRRRRYRHRRSHSLKRLRKRLSRKGGGGGGSGAAATEVVLPARPPVYRIPPDHLIAIELEFGHWMRDHNYAFETPKIQELMDIAIANDERDAALLGPPKPLPAPVIHTDSELLAMPPPQGADGLLPIDPINGLPVALPPPLYKDQPYSFNRVMAAAKARHNTYATAVRPRRCKPVMPPPRRLLTTPPPP